MKTKDKVTSRSTASTSTSPARSGKSRQWKSSASTAEKSELSPSAKSKAASSQSSRAGEAANAGSSRRGPLAAKKERITTVRLGDPVLEDLTDWARLDAMTDEEIERNAASDPDSFPVGSFDWTEAQLVIPIRNPKQSIHLRVDPDVLTWFKSRGSGHLSRMNAVLRNYYEAHKGQRED
ncbi:MAG TPA: BrnA antitoxin family protein [Bryobacteraceae bacterium]|nr:BrnA antitoxin family protein [Bryobacteraceae bacterium]